MAVFGKCKGYVLFFETASDWCLETLDLKACANHKQLNNCTTVMFSEHSQRDATASLLFEVDILCGSNIMKIYEYMRFSLCNETKS